MIKNFSVLKRICLLCIGSAIAIGFGYSLEKFKDSLYFISISSIVVFGSLFIYFLKNNVSFRSIISQYFLHIYILTYLVIRMSISTFREPIMDEFMLNTKQFAQFSSFFALGYGGFQLLSGYLMSLIGLRGIGFLAIGAGLCCATLSFCKTFYILLIGRFILGIFCSGGVCGLGYFINATLPAKLFSITYTLPLSMLLGIFNIINNYLNIAFKKKLIEWRFLMKILGFIAIIIGIIFLISIIGLKINNYNKDQSVDSNNDVEQFNKNIKLNEDKNTELNVKLNKDKNTKLNIKLNREKNTELNIEPNFGLSALIKSLVTDIRLIALCLYSATCTWLMYPFQDGYSAFILQEYFPQIPDFLGTSSASLAFGCGVLLTFIFSSLVGLELSMLIFSIVQIFSVILFFIFGKSSLTILLLCIQGFTLGGVGQVLAPMVVGKYYKGNKTAFYFGALNCSAMLFGAALSQLISGYVIHYSWKTHSTVHNGTTQYLAKDVFMMVKVFTIPTILALLCALFLFIKKQKSK